MTTLRAAASRFDRADWLVLVGLCTGTTGFALLGIAYGLIFLSIASLALFVVNVWMESR